MWPRSDPEEATGRDPHWGVSENRDGLGFRVKYSTLNSRILIRIQNKVTLVFGNSHWRFIGT